MKGIFGGETSIRFLETNEKEENREERRESRGQGGKGIRA